jgi:hypothetical protein
MTRQSAPRTTKYLDDHELKRVLERTLPSMERSAPRDALQMVARRLRDRLIELGGYYGTLEGSGIWRATIGESAELIGSSVEDELVSALRDSAGRILNSNLLGWAVVVAAVSTGEGPLFSRIVTYLLGSHHDPAADLVRSNLLDDQQLAAFLPEYRALLSSQFDSLATEDQGTLLERIVNGSPEAPEGADAEHFRRVWAYRRLFPLQGRLPEPYAGQLLDLEDQFEGQDPNPPRSGTWIGPTSPLSEDELAEREPAEVLRYLNSWQPPGGIFADSPHGLGRRFAIAVQRRAAEYSSLANEFRDLHATYIRELLSGLRSAVAEGAAIDWEPVLELLQHVVAKPRSDPGSFGMADAQIDRMDVDPDWRWTRKQAASLLEAGLNDQPGAIPTKLAGQVLLVVMELANDPEPDPEYERTYGGSNSDWDTLALNTVRPAAIAAVFQFLSWLPRQGDTERFRSDALTVLEEHLEINVDPSLAVRSVYGRWVPMLIPEADVWVTSAIPKVWPIENDKDAFFWAAWEPFLTFWRPHTGLFKRLQLQYERALERVGHEPKWRWLANPTQRLGEHLIAFYLAEDIEYSPWLAEFFGRVEEDTAERILSEFGRALDKDLGDKVERLMLLWSERMTQLHDSGGARPHEVSAFAWWFPQRSIPASWGLDQLLAVLAAGAKFDFPEEVVARLLEVAQEFPGKTVAALQGIVRQSEPWRLDPIIEPVRSILADAIRSDDPDASSGARQLIGELAMLHGRREFRDLLVGDE